MDLLVPTWNNAAERVFYLGTTEFAMTCARAGASWTPGGRRRRRSGCRKRPSGILDRLQHVTQAIYPQIDPSTPRPAPARSSAVGKTVGTVGVLFSTAHQPERHRAAAIHALDAFTSSAREFGSLVRPAGLPRILPLALAGELAVPRCAEVSVRQT
jgi:sulfite reductase (NADPH) flavoprotein alpha-component